jgi:hypothetical protein
MEQEIHINSQEPISSAVDEDEDQFSVDNMSTPGIMAAGGAGDTTTADLGTQTFDNFDITDNSTNTADDTLLPSRDMPASVSSSVKVVRAGIEATELDLGSLLRPSDEIDEIDFEPPEDMPDDARSIDGTSLDYAGDEPDLGEPDGIADDDQSADRTMIDTGDGGDTSGGGSNPTNNSVEDPCFDKATEYVMYGHPGAAQVFTLPDGEFSDLPRESQFEKRRKKDDPHREFHPFSSSAEWGLVKWLTRSGLSKTSIDEFCKLEWVSTDREWGSGIWADAYLTLSRRRPIRHHYHSKAQMTCIEKFEPISPRLRGLIR